MNKSIMKKNFILSVFSGSLFYLPTPVNISLWWNMGSLLGMCLILQIITGLFLSMHYTAHINYSFLSLIHIIQDVNYGWFMRSMHANGASMFFMCLYMHIGRGIYYGSYKMKKVWIIGIMIYLILMATAFLGYVLPWGQMSFWGATVITNLISAIPYFGQSVVKWIWGDFSVGNSTLNRFYSFHFLFPFILLLMVMIHLIFLHELGSSNPLGVSSDYYKIMFYPYFIYKDFMSMIYVFIMFLYIILIMPNVMGDPENFMVANSMITPIHIQPEWYFLFAYTILRSIPSKLGGVIALLMSIMILLIFPILYNNNVKSLIYYSLNKMLFFWFFLSFLLLTWLGAKSVEYPYVNISQWITFFYFLYYIMNFYILSFMDKLI